VPEEESGEDRWVKGMNGYKDKGLLIFKAARLSIRKPQRRGKVGGNKDSSGRRK